MHPRVRFPVVLLVLGIVLFAAFALSAPLAAADGQRLAPEQGGTVPPPPGSISGTVYNEQGETLSGIAVQLESYDAQGEFWSYWGTVSTAPDGTYGFTSLPATLYRVYFYDQQPLPVYASEYYDDARTPEAATPLDLSGTLAYTGIDAVLDTVHGIRGLVTDAEGVSLDSILVNALSLNEWGGWDYVAYTYTDAGGEYLFSGLAPGAYRLRFSDARWPGVYAPEYYNDALDVESAQPLEIVDASTDLRADVQMSVGSVIRGTVTDETPGSPQPIAGVYVQVARQLSTADWEWPGGMYTDASGMYTITALAPGNYRVQFEPPPLHVREYWNDKPTFDSADLVVLGADATVQVDAALADAAIIAGVVRDASGNPIGNIWPVAVHQESGSYYWGNLSDAGGVYAIAGLPPGEYQISFSDYETPARYLSSSYPLLVPVAQGEEVTLDPVTMQLGGVISGTVTGAVTGAPLEGIEVILNYSDEWGNWYYATSTSTGADGTYQLTALAPGTYTVGFRGTGMADMFYPDAYAVRDGTPLTIDAAGQTFENIDVQMVPGGSIGGVVTDQDTSLPLNTVQVTLRLKHKNGEYHNVAGMQSDGETGAYSFGSLGPGEYKVEFYDSRWPQEYFVEFWDDQPSLEAATPIALPQGGAIDGIDAALSKGGSISGRVTGPGGGGLADIVAEVQNVYQGWSVSATTLADGSYRIEDLEPGYYTLRFYPADASSPYMPEYYDDVTDAGAAAWIDLTGSGTLENYDAELALGGSIVGMVQDEAGSGIAGIQVRAWQPEFSWYNEVKNGTTAADGSFQLGGLQAGEYRVGFGDGTDPLQSYLPEFYDDKADIYSADPVTVTQGQVTSLANPAVLVASARITGTVTNELDEPVEEMAVVLYQYVGEEPWGWWSWTDDVTTDALGRYTFGPLPGGSYRVGFEDLWQGRYAAEYYPDALTIEAAETITVTTGATVPDISRRGAGRRDRGVGGRRVGRADPGHRRLCGIGCRSALPLWPHRRAGLLPD